jgi:hypothetical protein
MHTDKPSIDICSSGILNIAGRMLSQPWPQPAAGKEESDFDACAFLLARVDFKWLMAGQGWWIDPHRFQYDMPYADAVLRLALASQSLPLRECAASIQAQLAYPASL